MYSFTPEQIVSLLGHDTTILLKSNKSTVIQGYLYTIDPDTNNIVLFNTTQQRVHIVMNHDIDNIKSKNKIP